MMSSVTREVSNLPAADRVKAHFTCTPDEGLSEVGSHHPSVDVGGSPTIFVEEGQTSRIRERQKPVQSKSTDSKTYGVKAADWGIRRAGENEMRER